MAESPDIQNRDRPQIEDFSEAAIGSSIESIVKVLTKLERFLDVAGKPTAPTHQSAISGGL
jgi:hypothetical protein